MFEVFAYITGRTIGYTDSEIDADWYCMINRRCDYHNADHCSSGADRHDYYPA